MFANYCAKRCINFKIMFAMFANDCEPAPNFALRNVCCGIFAMLANYNKPVPIYLNIVPGENANFVSVLSLEPVCVQGPEYENDVSLCEPEFPVGQCLEVVERPRTERSLCVVPA
jgi:hypothetical protein